MKRIALKAEVLRNLTLAARAAAAGPTMCDLVDQASCDATRNVLAFPDTQCTLGGQGSCGTTK